MTIRSKNPATEQVIKTYQALTAPEIEQKLDQAQTAFETWRTTELSARQALVLRLADSLEDRADEAAQAMTMEMGKTLKAAHAELGKCIQFCRYSAEISGDYLSDTDIQTEYKRAFTRPLPLGPILLVMPWNFPFWQVIRVAVPALLAGNTCLLKHASNVPLCALKLEELFAQAGFPKGAFQTLLIGSRHVEAILKDERVKAASLTGSEAAGSAVAAVCGTTIKPCVLELGGADPFIVMPSADMDAAIKAAITGRMRNNGQSCIAAKRLIVHADIYDDFKARFMAQINAIILGDPLDPNTDMGPLCSQRALKGAKKPLLRAIEQGAVATSGAQKLPPTGYYMRPAVIENITKEMDIYYQEIFAPVAMLFKVDTFEDALTLANDSLLGLSSVLFSNDETEINTAIAELQSGSTFINRYASSDIRLPFGGIKRSGFGREMGKEGFREFTNLKTVIIAS